MDSSAHHEYTLVSRSLHTYQSRFAMTHLKIESKLAQPSSPCTPPQPPEPWWLPFNRMNPLPCNLQTKGLFIVTCQTKAVSKHKRSSHQQLLICVYVPGPRREAAAVFQPSGVPLGSVPGPRFGLYFPSLGRLMLACPCVGPRAVVRQGRLSVSSYNMHPFHPRKRRGLHETDEERNMFPGEYIPKTTLKDPLLSLWLGLNTSSLSSHWSRQFHRFIKDQVHRTISVFFYSYCPYWTLL